MPSRASPRRCPSSTPMQQAVKVLNFSFNVGEDNDRTVGLSAVCYRAAADHESAFGQANRRENGEDFPDLDVRQHLRECARPIPCRSPRLMAIAAQCSQADAGHPPDVILPGQSYVVVDAFSLSSGVEVGSVVVTSSDSGSWHCWPTARSRPSSVARRSTGIEVVSRDRGGGFGEAAARVLPCATQVADRWHFLRTPARPFSTPDAVSAIMRARSARREVS